MHMVGIDGGIGDEIRTAPGPVGSSLLEPHRSDRLDGAGPLGPCAHPRHDRDRAHPPFVVGWRRVAPAVKFCCTPRRNHHIQEPSRAAQLALGSRSVFRRNLHVRRRRGSRRSGGGARRDLPRAGTRDPAVVVAATAVERRARRQGERSSSLRFGERVLSALARSRDGVYLRLLPDAGGRAGRRTDRPRWIGCAGSSRCDRASASSKRGAAGAGSRFTWRGTMA